MVAGGRRDGIVRWLLPASLLHVAAVLLVAAVAPWLRPIPERASPQPRSPEPESDVELTLLDDGDGSSPIRAEPANAAANAMPPPPARDAPDEPRGPRIALGVPRLDAAPAVRDASKPSESASLDLASHATPDVDAPPPRDEPTTPIEPPREARPTLSLDQLGIGANPFLDVHVAPLTQREQANARLQAALHPPSLERDRQRSLGPAGPVAEAARNLVLSDDGLVDTSAVLNVRVDGAGRVTAVQVLDASSQAKAWQLIAARLAKALASVPLRTAASQRGWDLKLRLGSSVQLPSGAAPGLRMGVLGQQVAGNGGPGSTSLELSPTAKLDIKEPIDSIGRHLDDPIRFEVMLLKFRADPSDIGATARRVVEVALLSIEEAAAP